MSGTMHGLYRKEGEERQPEDFYATEPGAIPPLLKILGPEWEQGGKFIYECACVDSETEFYNGFSWKKISDYDKTDKVFCYKESGEGFLEYPLAYIKNKSDEEMYHYTNRFTLDMCLTKNHRIVYTARRKPILEWDYAENVFNSYYKDSNGFRGKIPTTFFIKSNIRLNEWFLRLAVACNADGRTRTIIKKTYEIRVKKQRKKDRILWLLKNACIPYKILKSPEGYLNVTFESPYGCKCFPKEWLFLSEEYRKIIIDEIKYWDGWLEDGLIKYSSSKKDDVDLIQMIAHSLNYHCSITEDNRTGVTNYILCFGNVNKFALRKSKKGVEYLKIEKPKDGFVYCFKVSSGMLVLRRNNRIFITGNCGQGHLSNMLELYGHRVVSTDLIDRGYGVGGVDFLNFNIYETMEFDAIITNPPYKYALEFVEKSIKIAPLVCMFLRIQFIESERRDKLFEENPPRYIAVFRKRVLCSKDAKFPKGESSATCYAWFIWERGYKGNPELLRI